MSPEAGAPNSAPTGKYPAAPGRVNYNVHASIDLTRPGPLLTAIAVRAEGRPWEAICRELDIATCGGPGDGAEQVLRDLWAAVRDVARVAVRENCAMGKPVPDEALRDFLLSHTAPEYIKIEIRALGALR